MDPQKFGDSYDFVKSVPRQLFLPVPHLLQAVLAPSLVLRGIGAASQPGRRCDFAVSCG